MKVKPFYIRITDDMTPQMVQDAFDKCVDAGAKCDEWESFIEPVEWKFFGFCGVSGMYLTDYSEDYEANSSGDAQEITLDQLDEWLGLDNEQEWKNGDECEHGHHDYSVANKMTYIGAHPFVSGKHVCLSELKGIVIVDSIWLRKPETPEQKAERERLEASYDLYCNAQHAVDVIGYDSFGVFKSDKVQVKFWLSIVDKTGYRKAK